MRLWKRKRPDEPMTTYSLHEFVSFVGLMVHDLGHRVAVIRNIVDSLQREPEFRSARGREGLDHLARAADDLAAGFRMMRTIGSAGEATPCDFVVDVIEPAVSLAGGGRNRTRLLVDPSARKAHPVRLRPGPAFLAVVRLITRHEPQTIRCKASNRSRRIVFTLELSGEFNMSTYTMDSAFEGLLSEAGVLSTRLSSSEDGSRLVAALEIEEDQ